MRSKETMIDPGYEILNAIEDGVLIIDQDYKIVFGNQSFLNLHQPLLENIAGEKCYTILHGCSTPCLEKCVIEKIFQEGLPVTHEHEHLLADGRKRIFQISASPLRNEQGEVDRMLQLFKDVTEQHESRMALSSSQQELERLFNSAPFTISYLDRQLRVMRLNPAMEKFVGKTTEEVKGQHCYNVWGQYAKDKTKKAEERICDVCRSKYALRDGKSYVYQRQVGDTFFEVLSIPVLDQHNTVIGVMEIGNDITARKQAETALLKSKEEWERTFDSIPDIVTLQDSDFRIVKVNQAGCDTLGLTCDAIIGRRCYELFHGGNEPCSLCPLLKTKKDFQPYSREMYHGQLDKTFLVSAAPVVDEHGTLEYIAHIAKDITEQKRLQRESDQRLQQIIQADKLASLGEVVAGVAHEINNPNSFISYNLPMLEEIWQVLEQRVDKDGFASPETAKKEISVNELCRDMDDIIESIRVGSERINQVVNNLKDFARHDETAHRKPVQLNEVIEQTYTIVGAQVRKSVSNIAFHLAWDLPTVMGHFQKLEQVMANILINAGHALEEKQKGRIIVSTRFIERLGAVGVSVEDSGAGMESGTIDRIFEPFFTTRRDSGGTGLGLSVSYGLIREHKGVLAVLSQPGIGTRFTLLLPTEQQSDQLNLQPAILLMDEGENLSASKELLQEITDSTIFTLDGREPLIPFLEEHPEVDIVFSAIKTSHINGREALEEIKKQFPLVTVCLYAESDAEHTENQTSFEPDRLLQKPLNTVQLQDCIDSINRIHL